MSDVSEESLLDYFYTAGANTGKVKNAEILKTYKPFIGHRDLQLRAKFREEFKLIIDRIAVVKSENGEKYLVLKKKYRQLLLERHPDVTDRDVRGLSTPPRSPPTAPSPPSSPQRVIREDLLPASGPQDRSPPAAPSSPQRVIREDLLPASGPQDRSPPAAPSSPQREIREDLLPASGPQDRSPPAAPSPPSSTKRVIKEDLLPASGPQDRSPPAAPSSPQREIEEDLLSASGSQDRGSGQVMWGRGPSITLSEAPDQPHSQEDQHTEGTSMEPVLKEAPTVPTEEPGVHMEPVLKEPGVHSNGEDEMDKDSGSKSESEQDEEGTGSMGSPAVALEPLEKEWIYSAACARVTDLSQLLIQDPSLANKKDFTSTALHWAAKHGKEDMATLVADAGADVNIKSGYTPLHIAALHGHQKILDLLIGTYGAKENLRDYSGHLACHYLNPREPAEPEEYNELQFHVAQVRERNRNRKLSSLFHSKKKWGSAEELAPLEEERSAPHQLIVPACRHRKFSR